MAEMVPEIRLEGFTDPWEQRKLGELGEFNPKSQLPESFEYVDLESVVGTEMIGHRREDRSTAPSRAQRLAQTGDIFYQTVRPYQKNNYLYELPDEDFVFSTGYAQIRPLIDPGFLFCLLQQDSVVADVLDKCTGTSYPAINANDLADIEVSTSANTEEQRLIGCTIASLDNLITLHQREYDKLVTAKTTFVQRMYPELGADEARLRFGGYTGPFERRQVKTIFREYDVRDHAGLPVLSAHQKLGMVPRAQIGYEIFHDEAQEKTYKHIRPGQFVIHLRSFQGGFAHSAVEGIASPAYTVLEFCDGGRDYDLYWKHLFMSRLFIDCLRVVTYGIRDGRSISVPEFKELYFYTPSYDEQKAIGDFFEEMDKLIRLEASQLEKLKQVKSTLLRKMFV